MLRYCAHIIWRVLQVAQWDTDTQHGACWHQWQHYVLERTDLLHGSPCPILYRCITGHLKHSSSAKLGLEDKTCCCSPDCQARCSKRMGLAAAPMRHYAHCCSPDTEHATPEGLHHSRGTDQAGPCLCAGFSCLAPFNSIESLRG